MIERFNKELLNEINTIDYWDEDLCREACYSADCLDELDLSEDDWKFLIEAVMSVLEAQFWQEHMCVWKEKLNEICTGNHNAESE